jgi:hypothetical protein
MYKELKYSQKYFCNIARSFLRIIFCRTQQQKTLLVFFFLIIYDVKLLTVICILDDPTLNATARHMHTLLNFITSLYTVIACNRKLCQNIKVLKKIQKKFEIFSGV